jgi:hypothetical protein
MRSSETSADIYRTSRHYSQTQIEEKDYFIYCNSVYSDRYLLTFRMNMLPPSSGYKSNPDVESVVRLYGEGVRRQEH